MEKIAESYKSIKISDREQAIFELGIKLSAIFHQFLGTPIKNDKETMNSIAKGIEAAIKCQPFVSSVKVTFQPFLETEYKTYQKKNEFDYTAISERNLIAEVEICYKNWIVQGKSEWIKELHYPLMYISDIKKLE